ncbi:hypothetical protein D3C87_1724400 [compost metagenome]
MFCKRQSLVFKTLVGSQAGHEIMLSDDGIEVVVVSHHAFVVLSRLDIFGDQALYVERTHVIGTDILRWRLLEFSA